MRTLTCPKRMSTFQVNRAYRKRMLQNVLCLRFLQYVSMMLLICGHVFLGPLEAIEG